MPTPPSFVLPPDRLTARLRDHAGRLLAGVGRQRVVLAIVALVALACAAVIWFRGTPRPIDPTMAGAQASAAVPVAAPVSSSDGLGAAAAVLAVDVVGRVRHPGLVRLPAGSRVIDAIRAAGGAAPGADLDAVNLARKLADGEQLRVPRHGEAAVQPGAVLPGAGAGAGGSGAIDPGGPAGGPIDLNTATAEQLDTLPGVGQVTASRIIAWRSAHPFTSVDDLRQVPGIGDRRFATLKDLVTVSTAPWRPAVAQRARPGPGRGRAAATVAAGVLLGTWAAAGAGIHANSLAVLTLVLAAGLAGTLLCSGAASGAAAGFGRGPGLAARPVLGGALVLVTLAATGAAVAATRLASSSGGLLPRLAAAEPGVAATVTGTVAEEPRMLRDGAELLTLRVDRVTAAGRTWRTRERAAVVFARGAGPPASAVAVGGQLRLHAGVQPAPAAHLGSIPGLSDQPPVTLRRPHLDDQFRLDGHGVSGRRRPGSACRAG